MKSRNLLQKVLSTTIVLSLLILLQAFSIRLVALPKGSIFQEKTVTGKVTSADSPDGLPGVNIIQKGTLNGTTTGIDGRYNMNVSGNATLVFSSVGFLTQEVTVNNQSVIDINLQVDITQLEELVVIGYGTIKKNDVTGSLTSVSSKDLTTGNITNAANALQGRIPANVVQSSAAPGSTPRIEIRGISSLTGSNDPLWVVDGVPMQSNNLFLNPNDIESIEILKDASATAIYGSRGSNGVVIVTTKKGISGKQSLSISYDAWVSSDQVAKYSIPDLQNGEEYATYRRLAFQNAGQPNDDQLIFDDVQRRLLSEGRYTDWFDLAWGGNATSTNHNLSVNFTSEKSATTVTLGYLNENSVISSADFTRYNLRFNNTLNLSERLTFNTNILANHSLRNAFAPTVGHAVPLNPLGEAYDENGRVNLFGNPSEALITNPLAEIQNNINEVRNNGFLGSVSLQWEIIDGLEYKIFAGTDFSSARNGLYQGSETYARSGAPFASRYNNESVFYTIVDNILSYNKTFGKSRINAVGAFNMESNRSERVFLQGTNMDYDGLFYNLQAASTIIDKGTFLEEWGIMSFMSRINYTFDDRYVATVTYRRDGSSRLAEGKKWADFPSVALAWRIKEESFMQDLNFIDNLKLRLSWGNTGNTNVDPYATLGRLGQTLYTWGEAPAIGYRPVEIPNPSLGWETTIERNLGVDFGFLGNRVSGAVDFYSRSTTNLMLPRLLPPSSGFDRITQNIGEVKNTGIELSLNGLLVNTEQVKWDLGIVFNRNINEIVALATDSDDLGNRWFIGEPIRVNFLLDYVGVWQTDEETEAAVYGAKPGFPKYVDVENADENAPRISLDRDRVISPRDPAWVGGLNTNASYKGFQLSMSFNVRQGVRDLSIMHRNRDERYNGLNRPYWTPENPTNIEPRPDVGNARQLLNDSDFHVHDLSFVRLNNVTLGYQFPQNLCEALGTRAFRAYFNVRNPLIWTDYEGMDPEMGTSHLNHPTLISYQFGVNLNF
jgi:TonB-linked SusC/RagA family outer membrane protein